MGQHQWWLVKNVYVVIMASVISVRNIGHCSCYDLHVYRNCSVLVGLAESVQKVDANIDRTRGNQRFVHVWTQSNRYDMYMCVVPAFIMIQLWGQRRNSQKNLVRLKSFLDICIMGEDCSCHKYGWSDFQGICMDPAIMLSVCLSVCLYLYLSVSFFVRYFCYLCHKK